MDTTGTINNSKELEFVVFCVENVAAELGSMPRMCISHSQMRATF